MANNAEALDLTRRARRRLIGAIALVLALVIVPPWIMDLEPKPVTTDLTVQIPGRDSKRLAPPAPARAPEPVQPAKAESPPKPEPVAKVEPKAASKGAPEPPKPAAPQPAPKAETVARAAPADAANRESESKRAEAILNGEAFVVPLGAFANRDNVKSLEGKLAKAGVKYYTEKVAAAGGEQTRVRAGPYPTREAAEKVREQLKALGLAPGNVSAKQ
jgi:DedD protein